MAARHNDPVTGSDVKRGTFERPPILEGGLCRLRPLRPEDAADLVAAAAEDPSLYRWTWVPESIESALAYIEEATHDPFVGFATIRLSDGRLIGSTRLKVDFWHWPAGHEFEQRTTPDVAEIGWTWLAASAVRSGINTEAKLLQLRHAFEVWGVHAVILKTDRRNERSRAAIERLGARLDGVLRAARPAADGTIRDSAYYSILAEEWPSVEKRLETLLAR